MHRIITKIETKDDLILIATFADGEVVSFDVKTLFDKYPIFKELEDRELFDSVHIDGIGYGISWNDEIDLASEGIYAKGTHIDKVEPETRIIIGLNIAEAREILGMSQRDLSSTSGVMQAEISKIEQGKGNPTVTTLQKIAKALRKTVASLFL
jgi:DNA-binding XRE family transcriptional regulator